MNENLQIWMEILFNVLYLITVWVLVYLMTINLKIVREEDKNTTSLIRTAFFLLALGDSGHVGFRVIAYALGGLETNVFLLGKSINLVGLGSLSTAITVTFFYMLLVYVWKNHFDKSLNIFAYFLLGTGILRLILMALPGNDWGSIVPPQPMSLVRNAPLVIQGLGILYLFFKDARQKKDTTFQWIGWMILASFTFYAPVILFVQKIPLIGMLMIPKTCAYLAIAIIAYKNLWKETKLVDKLNPEQL